MTTPTRTAEAIRRRLREQFGDAARYRPPDERIRPTGWRELDLRLPHGGLPVGGLANWSGPGLGLLIRHVLEDEGGVVIADGSPGTGADGIAGAWTNVTILRCETATTLLRAFTLSLESGTFRAGVYCGPTLPVGTTRRLALAASRGDSLLVASGRHPGARIRVYSRATGAGLEIEAPRGHFIHPTSLPRHAVPLFVDPRLPDRRGRGD